MSTPTPQRIVLSRVKGFTLPPNTLKVDRSTRYGNPFAILREARGFMSYRVVDTRAHGHPTLAGNLPLLDAQRTARDLFRLHTLPTLNLKPLRGKNLACWCLPSLPCHSEVLLEAANRKPKP